MSEQLKTFTEILSHKITNMNQVHKTMRDLRREVYKALDIDQFAGGHGLLQREDVVSRLREVLK